MVKTVSAKGYVPVGEKEMYILDDLRLNPREVRDRLRAYLIGNKRHASEQFEDYNPRKGRWKPVPIKKIMVTVTITVEDL